LAAACLLLPGLSPAMAQNQADPGRKTYSYEAKIAESADISEELREKLRDSALAFRLSDNPPGTRAGLSRRAEDDIERLTKVLRSTGFYDAEVTFTIDPPQDQTGTATLTYRVVPGTPYLLADIMVLSPGGQPAPASDEVMDRMRLHAGRVAEAQAIIDAEDLLSRHYQERGYPFADVTGRKARINTDDKTMTVTFSLDKGEELRFGGSSVLGLTNVTENHVREFILWEEGEPYDIRKLEDTQRKLDGSGLFSVVSVETESGSKGGRVPVMISVEERAHRSIGFGARFSTSEGPAGNVFWEHRNLFGEGEKLNISAVGSKRERGVEGLYSDPLLQQPRTNFLIESEIKSVRTDAYTDKHAALFSGIERELSESWSATVGPTVEYYDITASEDYDGGISLLGIRGRLDHDSSDDRLNPSKGNRLRIAATPYTAFGASRANFLLSSVEGSSYYAIDDDGRYVVAGRARLAATVGAGRRDIPPSKRFYAGGGGSVRGYAFQTVGPLDEENEPVGGRSAAELGLELRLRLTDSIGIVPFVEGGNVYKNAVPDFKEPDFLWGAGIGLRYHTDFGPIRLDIATPINAREVVDKPFQFYVSFGQAF
jgi:translocation and assembly module TamA